MTSAIAILFIIVSTSCSALMALSFLFSVDKLWDGWYSCQFLWQHILMFEILSQIFSHVFFIHCKCWQRSYKQQIAKFIAWHISHLTKSILQNLNNNEAVGWIRFAHVFCIWNKRVCLFRTTVVMSLMISENHCLSYGVHARSSVLGRELVALSRGTEYAWGKTLKYNEVNPLILITWFNQLSSLFKYTLVFWKQTLK